MHSEKVKLSDVMTGMGEKHKSNISFHGMQARYHEGIHGDHMVAGENFAMMINNKSHSRFLTGGIVYQHHHNVIVFVKSGSANAIVNLENFTWQAGDIIVMSSYTMLEVKTATPDFDMVVVYIGEEVPTEGNMVLHTTPDEWQEMMKMVDTLWTVARHHPFRKEVVMALAASMISNVQYITKKDALSNMEKLSNDERIFWRFKRNVDKYADKEHYVSFYAEQQCLSANYLSTIVSKVSGSSATEWINRALVLHAKVLLKTTQQKTSEIADSLGFSDHATFTKFFKRETGLTPREFRENG